MRIVVLFLALLLAADVARAEDYPECAQYKNDFAYNACLARHGPKGYLGQPAPGPRAEAPGGPAPGRYAAPPLRRGRHGRVRAVFPVGGRD